MNVYYLTDVDERESTNDIRATQRFSLIGTDSGDQLLAKLGKR